MTAKRRETNVLRIMHLLSITGFGKVGNIFILLLIFILEYIKEMINIDVNDTLRMYKNDDIRMYNFNCITDTIVEVITTCNTYTLLTVHLL